MTGAKRGGGGEKSVKKKTEGRACYKSQCFCIPPINFHTNPMTTTVNTWPVTSKGALPSMVQIEYYFVYRNEQNTTFLLFWLPQQTWHTVISFVWIHKTFGLASSNTIFCLGNGKIFKNKWQNNPNGCIYLNFAKLLLISGLDESSYGGINELLWVPQFQEGSSQVVTFFSKYSAIQGSKISRHCT